MSARYSNVKMLAFPDRLNAIREGRPAAPVHVQLILSDLCNQDCHFCCFRNEASDEKREWFADGEVHNPNRMLAFEKVIEILDDCAEMGVRGIELTGGGEPTIHKRFDDVIEAINRRDMRWGLITNGVRHRDLSTAEWVRVSLDAAKPETYAAVRRVPGEHFGKALETISRWHTNVSFVVTPQNWGEIFEAATMAKGLGARSFRVRPQDDLGLGLFSPDVVNAIQAECRRIMDLAAGSFEVDARFDFEIASMREGAQDYDRCAYQHFKTWIGADENLYRCCIYAYSPRGFIASLKGKRFKDVWREEAMRDFQGFSARGCEQCRYGTANRIANEVIDMGNEAFV